jgi:radical SAM superfamily enzyme YgiQ (UPF0313 family)
MNNRVLIITVPRQDVVRPPGALAVLAACCEKTNSDYKIFDLNLYMHKTLKESAVLQLNSDFTLNKFSKNSQQQYATVCQEAVDQIQNYHPNIVAISVFTKQSLLAADFLLQQLQRIPGRSNFQIVIGGLGVLDNFKTITGDKNFGDHCLHHHLTDYYITGDGELSFVEFLKGNTEYPGINSGDYVQVTDLDSIPTPSYKKIDPRDYFFSNEPEIVITGSKGCVRDCSFCDVGKYWKKYIYRSGIHVANDMYEIYKTTGVNKFEFSDSLINGSLKSFRQLNQRLIELKQQDPDFSPQYKGQFICRPIGQMKEQDYINMKQAGVETLVVGIEHFSESIRTHMRKYFDNASIDWHFEQCAKLGIKNVLLMLSGYVTETAEDHQTNLDYLYKYRKYALSRIIYAISMSPTGLVIGKDTPLFDMLHDIGVEIDEEFDTWVNVNNLSLTPIERLRRSIEIIHTAASLNYNVLNFDQKLDEIKTTLPILQQQATKKKIPIVSI